MSTTRLRTLNPASHHEHRLKRFLFQRKAIHHATAGGGILHTLAAHPPVPQVYQNPRLIHVLACLLAHAHVHLHHPSHHYEHSLHVLCLVLLSICPSLASQRPGSTVRVVNPREWCVRTFCDHPCVPLLVCLEQACHCFWASQVLLLYESRVFSSSEFLALLSCGSLVWSWCHQ
jgi:hypothetical protein